MDSESFKDYKTTDEYKALDPKEKRKLRDKFRYMEKREEKLNYQKEYDQSHSEQQKQIRAEKSKSKKTLRLQHFHKNLLLENPKHELGKRLFHFIQTGEKDLNIHGTITDEDLEFLKSFILPDIPEPERKEYDKHYYEEHREEKLFQAKSYRDKRKEEESIKSINQQFRLHDPNCVISHLEIQMNPLCYLDKFSQREVFKFKTYHSLAESEKPAFLKKCREEHFAYYKAVEDLPLEEKKQFLKNYSRA